MTRGKMVHQLKKHGMHDFAKTMEADGKEIGRLRNTLELFARLAYFYDQHGAVLDNKLAYVPIADLRAARQALWSDS